MTEEIPSEPVILDKYDANVKLLTVYHEAPDQWRKDQAGRLYNEGEWKFPPWNLALHEIEQGLFPHLSSERDGMIAYTPSPAYGEKGRIVRTKPGRYLTRFRPDLSQKEREAICATMGATVLVDGNVLFARDEDDIEEVYVGGPKSCMSDGDEFSYEHPTRVYASPDMGVAYIKDTKGQVVARAVVSVKDKRYGRLYPTPQNWEQNTELYMSYSDAAECQTTLERGLKALGYEHGSFNGNRINKIHIESKMYVMPYIDGGYGVELSECKNYFVLNADKPSCGNTSGTYTFQTGIRCTNCSSYAEPEDMYDVRQASGVREWCENCHGEHAFTCTIDGETYSSYNYSEAEVEGLGTCRVENARASEHVRYCSGSYGYFHEATVPYKQIDGEYYRDDWLAGSSREFHQNAETGDYHWTPRPPRPPAPTSTSSSSRADYADMERYVMGILSRAGENPHTGFGTQRSRAAIRQEIDSLYTHGQYNQARLLERHLNEVLADRGRRADRAMSVNAVVSDRERAMDELARCPIYDYVYAGGILPTPRRGSAPFIISDTFNVTGTVTGRTST